MQVLEKHDEDNKRASSASVPAPAHPFSVVLDKPGGRALALITPNR